MPCGLWAGAWPRKARMALRSTAVGLLGLSSFDCRVSGAPSTKDALHFNEDIRRCDSASVATPASSLVSTDCRRCALLHLPLSSYLPLPNAKPAPCGSQSLRHSVSQFWAESCLRVPFISHLDMASGEGERENERGRETG